MRINNNIAALNSHRQYGINNGNIGKNVEKLSSGFRVNRAADDAAGLAISEKMRTQIRGLTMASKNSQDGISLVQTAEGAMQTAHNIMQRMRELAVQSSNGTNDATIDRKALELEFSQLNTEIGQIADTVKFNDMEIFDKTFTIQSGANAADITVFTVASLGMIQYNTGVSAGIDFTRESDFNADGYTPDEARRIRIDDVNPTYDNTYDFGSNARLAITAMTSAINLISMNRAQLGSIQNRLEFKIQNLDNSA
ncbi:MAG: flagellin, partial [Oscillospiraceae bacterium]|nr:flagellin [Oscillospiraceae bacterium]